MLRYFEAMSAPRAEPPVKSPEDLPPDEG
jgi:hypothetical protein